MISKIPKAVLQLLKPNASDCRRKLQQVALSGHNFVKEWVEKHGKENLRRLFVTKKYLEKNKPISDEFTLVSQEALDRATREGHSQGILALVPQLAALSAHNSSNNPYNILYAPNIHDPRNLGGLIRSACAFGWKVMLKDGCDPYHPIVVSVARASHVIHPILIERLRDFSLHQSIAAEVPKNLKQSNMMKSIEDSIVLLSAKIDMEKPKILIVGNETCGLPEDICPDAYASIKIRHECSSLNVVTAASILMAYLSKPSNS